MALLAVGPGRTGVGLVEGVGLGVGVNVPLQVPVCCALFRVTVQGALLMVVPVAANPMVVPATPMKTKAHIDRNLRVDKSARN